MSFSRMSYKVLVNAGMLLVEYSHKMCCMQVSLKEVEHSSLDVEDVLSVRQCYKSILDQCLGQASSLLLRCLH